MKLVNSRLLNHVMRPLTHFGTLDISPALGADTPDDDDWKIGPAVRAAIQEAAAIGGCCIELSPQDHRPPGSDPHYLSLDGRRIEKYPVWHPYREKRGRGRPPGIDGPQSGKARMLYATAREWESLREIGRGNASRGMRVALLAVESLGAAPARAAPPEPPGVVRFPPGPITPALLAAGALVTTGSQLRALRARHGLTQRECAELAGVGLDTWKKPEQHAGDGVRSIKPLMVARFLQRTGWTPPPKADDLADLLG